MPSAPLRPRPSQQNLDNHEFQTGNHHAALSTKPFPQTYALRRRDFPLNGAPDFDFRDPRLYTGHPKPSLAFRMTDATPTVPDIGPLPKQMAEAPRYSPPTPLVGRCADDSIVHLVSTVRIVRQKSMTPRIPRLINPTRPESRPLVSCRRCRPSQPWTNLIKCGRCRGTYWAPSTLSLPRNNHISPSPSRFAPISSSLGSTCISSSRTLPFYSDSRLF